MLHSATELISRGLDAPCDHSAGKSLPLWTSFCHRPHASDSMRIVSEIYLAARAAAFYYNNASTFQHLVRRLRAPATRMLALRSLHPSEPDYHCAAR